jgi:hypothetical protein
MTTAEKKAPTTLELLDLAKSKRANAEKERIEKHNEAFAVAYLKALETSAEETSFVEVEIPKVGKCLFKFPDKARHAEFKRHANAPGKALEMGPCVTYSTNCCVFPGPVPFKDICDKYNVQGFEIAALKIFHEMAPKDKAEGESSATEA